MKPSSKNSNKLKETQIFTPRHITNKMLDLLEDNNSEIWKNETTYLFEPCCGDGEMLIVCLQRIYNKLLEKNIGNREKSLAECCFKFYAIELDKEMVIKARIKIYEFIEEKSKDLDLSSFISYILAYLLQEKIENKDFFEIMKTRFEGKPKNER